MPSILDALRDTSASGVLRQAGDRPAHAAPELTEAERETLDAQVVGSLEDLARAEEVAKGLPRGHHIWSCPGCTFEMRGPEGGGEHAAYKSHIKRHPLHIRNVAGPSRLSAPR